MLLLQTPGRRRGASQEFLFAVRGLEGDAGDHLTVQAQIGQFTCGQAAQFADRLVVDAAALHRSHQVLHNRRKSLYDTAVGVGRAAYISHLKTRLFPDVAGPFCFALELKMGQLLQLHNT